MKWTTWLRRDPKDGVAKLKIDMEYEDKDDPPLQRAGRRILKAMGWIDKEDKR